MELGLAGKKVLIIGGSGDLGKSIAASFVSEGCHVHIVGRDVDKQEAGRVPERIE
ncbi:MAG: NmrA family NAD(P)-binding protein [Acidihalobacter sp.]